MYDTYLLTYFTFNVNGSTPGTPRLPPTRRSRATCEVCQLQPRAGGSAAVRQSRFCASCANCRVHGQWPPAVAKPRPYAWYCDFTVEFREDRLKYATVAVLTDTQTETNRHTPMIVLSDHCYNNCIATWRIKILRRGRALQSRLKKDQSKT